MTDEYFTKEEAARHVKLSVRYIDYAVAKHELAALRFGKLVRFRRADVDAWAATHRVAQMEAA